MKKIESCYISEADQAKIEEFLEAGSSNIKIRNEYWIGGGRGGEVCGESYCYDCCRKAINQLRKKDLTKKEIYFVDGGWETESDSIRFCTSCRVLLATTFTDCGSEDEVDHFLQNGFDVKDELDCYSLGLAIFGRGWRPWADKIFENKSEMENDAHYYQNLHKLCRIILADHSMCHRIGMENAGKKQCEHDNVRVTLAGIYQCSDE